MFLRNFFADRSNFSGAIVNVIIAAVMVVFTYIVSKLLGFWGISKEVSDIISSLMFILIAVFLVWKFWKRSNSLVTIIKTLDSPFSAPTIAKKDEVVRFEVGFSPTPDSDWSIMRDRIEKFFNREFLVKHNENKDFPIKIYPLAHIPLLIYFGHLISDRLNVSILQYDRDNGDWVHFKDNHIQSLNPYSTWKSSELESDQIIVSVSVTGNVKESDIIAATKIESFDYLAIKIDNPEVDSVLYAEHVKEIVGVLQKDLRKKVDLKAYKELHLFYAGPAGLAVEIGRVISLSMFPKVHLYNYQYQWDPRYHKVMTLGN